MLENDALPVLYGIGVCCRVCFRRGVLRAISEDKGGRGTGFFAVNVDYDVLDVGEEFGRLQILFGRFFFFGQVDLAREAGDKGFGGVAEGA